MRGLCSVASAAAYRLWGSLRVCSLESGTGNVPKMQESSCASPPSWGDRRPDVPLQHYACSRSLCTAYRLLEDYGSLRPGDTIIQNCSDLPVGQAVIQLCNMLKIRTINLVTDDEGFERTKELLMQLGRRGLLNNKSEFAFIADVAAELLLQLGRKMQYPTKTWFLLLLLQMSCWRKRLPESSLS